MEAENMEAEGHVADGSTTPEILDEPLLASGDEDWCRVATSNDWVSVLMLFHSMFCRIISSYYLIFLLAAGTGCCFRFRR
jgi:hypothetical protein